MLGPTKQFVDTARVIGIAPSILVLLGHKDSLSRLRYQSWIAQNEKTNRDRKLMSLIKKADIKPKIVFKIYGDTKNNKKLALTVESIDNQLYQDISYGVVPFCKTVDNNTLTAFVESGDRLSNVAAAEIVLAHNAMPHAKLIYADQDSLSGFTRVDPFFKPDWSPELLRNYNYLGGLVATPMALSNRELSAIKDSESLYRLVVRKFIKLKKHDVVHISKILNHSQSKPQFISVKRSSRIAAKNQPKITIIIPFRDKIELLKCCVQSIVKKTRYQNYEILLVNNASIDSVTYAFLDTISSNDKVSIIEYNDEFNYSAINNYAVGFANSELILFLNNDTEVIAPNWLDEMVATIQNKDVGAVGARLLYSDGNIQHAGVTVGLGGAAGHPFRGLPSDNPGYFGMAKTGRNTLAVTGACLLTRKTLFKKLNGFDATNLAITYNDVDYCLKVVESGKEVIYNPHAELYHHESASRGKEEIEAINQSTPEMLRHKKELRYFQKKWKKYIKNDPYYSSNLTKKNESYNINI